MKKLILLFAMAMIFSCKKNDPQPKQQTTNTSTQKYNYSWDYKKAGDNTTYSASECLTEDQMLTKQQMGAFNVQRWGNC